MPSLAARGQQVLAAWLGPGFTNGLLTSSVGFGYSMDGGITWVYDGTLSSAPPFDRAGYPAFPCIGGDGSLHLITDYYCLQYFGGTPTQPVSWSTPLPLLCFPMTDESNDADIPAIATDPSGAHVYVTVTERKDLTYESWIRFVRSTDRGATWDVPIELGRPNAAGSSLAVGPDGTVCLTWVDYVLGAVILAKSFDHGATFSPALPVAPILDNLSMPPIGWKHAGSPSRFYPHYRFASAPFAANFPALAVDRSTGPTRGNLYIVWADHADGVASPPTTGVFSREPNDTFAAAQPIPLDCGVGGALDNVHGGSNFRDVFVFAGTKGETIEITGSADTFVGVAVFMELANGEQVLINSSLTLFAEAGVGTIKPAIITLPRTGRYFLQVDGSVSGAVYEFYLQRYTPSAGSVARDMRDIVLIRSADGGSTWSPKVRVNQDPAGVDQHHPNVAVDERGRVYVAWYDRRDSQNGLEVAAYGARSVDGGLAFESELRLSSHLGSWYGPGWLVRDRIGIAAGDEFGIVAWSDFHDWPTREPEVWAARIVDIPTATEAVSDLSAEPMPAGVRLRWLVNDVRAVSGLRVHRAGGDGAELPLGERDLVPTREGEFEYVDASAQPGQTYAYRLAVRSGASTRWLGPVTVAVPARITALACRAAGPNPFGRRTAVALAVPRAAEGAVRVYDVQGKAVRTLAEGRFEPGERTLEWDGRDAAGVQAAPGIYFVAAEVGGEHARLRVARVP